MNTPRVNALLDGRFRAEFRYGLMIGIAALDVWLLHTDLSDAAIIASCVGLLALLLARKYPVTVYLCTLPALVLGSSLLIVAIAAYQVGRHAKRNIAAVAGILPTFVLLTAGEYPIDWTVNFTWFMSQVIFCIMLAAAPVLLGRLVSARHALREQLREVVRAREESAALHTQAALALDRAQLAREMHDVVSHQVSLIAVRAGALEMSSADSDTTAAAATIRGLSVKTLDELRHMVTVLRASGTVAAGLAPQPTVDALPDLLATSGLDITVTGQLPTDLPAPLQRAVYRTVQEALTNARKHAPGASVAVTYDPTPTEVVVVVSNPRGTAPRMALPSSGHGLAGLGERAALLDGTLRADAQPDGGFRLELRPPR
ncbi:two-component sensor histidine kinase [Nocardia uniformis]|uniref:histidine kinase n=1 Tax=Nocardia uniformis TaxID=53432 RepID=A0A849CEE3_9NOCA|nr:histidine kinase [Nocardia uniformis]NNH71581.1 two-component sensor histidine kinase [Nocardia uniformis]